MAPQKQSKRNEDDPVAFFFMVLLIIAFFTALFALAVDISSHTKTPMDETEKTEGVEITIRDRPPVHYMLKVESFSLLSELLSSTKTNRARIESGVFEAEGCKWKLLVYLDRPKESGRFTHISPYLMIVERNHLPSGSAVSTHFKLTIYDHVRDKFYVYQDKNELVRRFHAMRKEWGFPRVLSLANFYNASKGYLAGDACVFGAEVFVISKNARPPVQCLSTIKEDKNFTWKIQNFSNLKTEMIESDRFQAGGHEWSLLLYPRGDPSAKEEGLSLFLKLNDNVSQNYTTTWSERKLAWAQFKELVKNHHHFEDYSAEGTVSSSSLKSNWGWSNFMPLRDLEGGFLDQDTLTVEARVDATSTLYL